MTTPTDILTAIKDRQLALASDLHDNAVEAQDLVDKAYQDEAAYHLETLALLATAEARKPVVTARAFAAESECDALRAKLEAADAATARSAAFLLDIARIVSPSSDQSVVDAVKEMAEHVHDLRAKLDAADKALASLATPPPSAPAAPTPEPHPDGCHSTDASSLRDCYSDGHMSCGTCTRNSRSPSFGADLPAAPTPDRGEAPRFVVVARGEVKGRPASVWSIRSGAEMRAAIYNSNPDLFENDTNNPDLADHAEWPFAVVDTGGGK